MDNLKFDQAGVSEWGSYKVAFEDNKLIITFRARKSNLYGFGDNEFYISLPSYFKWSNKFIQFIINIINTAITKGVNYQSGSHVMMKIRDDLRRSGFILDCPWFWETLEYNDTKILFCENPGILEIITFSKHTKYIANKEQFDYLRNTIQSQSLSEILKNLKLESASEG